MIEPLERALETKFTFLSQALTEPGYAVLPDLLSPALALTLAAETQAHWRAGAFHQAGVGRGAGWTRRPDIRSDEVFWVEGDNLSRPWRLP